MDKYERAIHDYDFSNEMISVRDMLQVIVDGMIERGHCVAGQRDCYGAKPGKRKLKIKDAQRIAADAIFRINRAEAKFTNNPADK